MEASPAARLLEYKRALNEAGAGDKAKKKKKQRKETKDVVLAKDFNNAAVIFYGEVGLRRGRKRGDRRDRGDGRGGDRRFAGGSDAAGVTYKTTGALTVDAVADGQSVSSGV